MNRTTNKLKCICIAGLAFFLAYRMCVSAADMAGDIKMQQGFGSVLSLGMQLVACFAVFVLCVTAIQNLLEFYVLCRYTETDKIDKKARRLIKFTIYLKIFASLALRLVFSMLFTVLAGVALFAPGVKHRDGGVYGAAIFMLALAGFMAFANIRLAKTRVREIRGGTQGELPSSDK